MKQRMMKLVALLTCATMVVGSFAACGGGNDTPDEGKENQEENKDPEENKENEGEGENEETPETYDFGGKVIKVYGSAWGDVDSEDLIKIEAKESVEKKYNVKFEKAALAGYAESDWDDQIITSVTNGDPIVDIICLNPENMLSCFMNGVLFDMTDYVDDYKFGSIYTDAGTWQGKCYGVSFDNLGDAWCLVYDRDLMETLGMEKTPTDMFMEGKWSYADFEKYCSDLQAKLQPGQYAIGQYPYHWGVMAAGANGTAICDMDCKLGLMDDGYLNALTFYKELETKGVAFPMKETKDADGNITAQDIVYAIDDVIKASNPTEGKIVMARAEAWQLGGLQFEYGVTFWPWGENVTCEGDYTTLSDNYKVTTCYWGVDSIINESCTKLGIPGETLMKIMYDYRVAMRGEDGVQFMHDAYESEQSGEPQFGEAFGEARSFRTDQDIELYDWAHSRFQADMSWAMASAGIFSSWKATADVLLRYQDARSAMESYMNTAKAALADAGVTLE